MFVLVPRTPVPSAVEGCQSRQPANPRESGGEPESRIHEFDLRLRHPIHHQGTSGNLLRNKLEFDYGKEPELGFDALTFRFLTGDEMIAAQSDLGLCFVF